MAKAAAGMCNSRCSAGQRVCLIASAAKSVLQEALPSELGVTDAGDPAGRMVEASRSPLQ
jgi:hypothetical protein